MDTLTKLRVCLAARGKIPTRTQIPLDLETLFVAFAQHPKRHAQYDECGVQATLNYLTTAAEHTYPRTESRARALLRSMVDWLLRRVHGPKNKPNPEFLFALRDIEATPVRLPGLVSAIAALPDPGEGAVLEYQLRARAMHVCAKRLEIAHEGSVLDQEAQVGFAAEALLAVLPLDRLLSTLRRAAAAHHATYAADDEDEEDSEESTEDEPGLLAETCGRRQTAKTSRCRALWWTPYCTADTPGPSTASCAGRCRTSSGSWGPQTCGTRHRRGPCCAGSMTCSHGDRQRVRPRPPALSLPSGS